MKIGAIDVSWFDIPLEARLKRIAEAGFDGVELWLTVAELGFQVWHPSLWKEVSQVKLSRHRLLELVNRLDLEITALGQQYLLEPSGELRTEKTNEVKALMEYASEIGVKNVILMSGGDPGKKEQWQPLLEVTKELASYAEDLGVVLAFENLPQFFIDDENALLKLIREVESKTLRVNFDPKNLNLCPPGDRDVPGAIKKLKNLIVHVHAGDSVYGGGPRGEGPNGKYIMRPLGQGTVPWMDCLKAFIEIGYAGYLVVEYKAGQTEGAIEGKRQLVKLLKTL